MTTPTPAERAALRRLHSEVTNYTTGKDHFFKAAVNALPSLLAALDATEAKLAESRDAHAETMARSARMVAGERTQADNARALADQLGARCVDLAERLATAEAKLAEAESGWRCFQCSERFTDEALARAHFSDGHEKPGCVDPLRADEKERLKELRDARELARKWRSEVEAADNDRALLASYHSEMGRLFGECGGVLASTPHQAWLKYEAMLGRAEAAEAKLAEAEKRECPDCHEGPMDASCAVCGKGYPARAEVDDLEVRLATAEAQVGAMRTELTRVHSHLIGPLADNREERRDAGAAIERCLRDLGLTALSTAPARGKWLTEEEVETVREEIRAALMCLPSRRGVEEARTSLDEIGDALDGVCAGLTAALALLDKDGGR